MGYTWESKGLQHFICRLKQKAAVGLLLEITSKFFSAAFVFPHGSGLNLFLERLRVWIPGDKMSSNIFSLHPRPVRLRQSSTFLPFIMVRFARVHH